VRAPGQIDDAQLAPSVPASPRRVATKRAKRRSLALSWIFALSTVREDRALGRHHCIQLSDCGMRPARFLADAGPGVRCSRPS
jgi:hypothetical protein